MALGISFIDDFSSRYAPSGATAAESASSNGRLASVRSVSGPNRELERAYRINALARSDDEGEVQAANLAHSRAVFSATKAELSAPDPQGTLAGVALGYANTVAEMKAAASRGDMEKAYSHYNRLDAATANFSSELVDRMSVEGTNSFERLMQVSYQNLGTRQFAKMMLQLPNGDTITAGEFFGAPDKGYRKYQSDSVMRSTFSTDVSAACRSDDPDKVSIMGLVVDPVTKTPGGAHPLRSQHREIADYVARNYDGLVGDLGVEGLRSLVADAVDNRAKAEGNPAEFMDAVRKWVVSRSQSGDGADPRDLVRGVLNTYGKLERSMTAPGNQTGKLSPAAERLLMKTFTAVAERADAGSIDFSTFEGSARAAEGFTRVMSITNTYDRMRIPLLSTASLGGADVGKALSDAVVGDSDGTGIPESNMFYQFSDALDTVFGIVSGGCQPAARDTSPDPSAPATSSAVLGATAGNAHIDNARQAMASSLLKLMTPHMARKSNVMDALSQAVSQSGGELAALWASDMRRTLGFKPRTAEALAGEAMRMLVGSGDGFVPVDFTTIFRSIALNDDFRKRYPEEHRDVMRFLKAHNYVAGIYREQVSQLKANLMDPQTGVYAGNEPAADAAVAHALMSVAGLAERGEDATPWLRAQSRHGRALQPTGRYVMPDGTYATPGPKVKIQSGAMPEFAPWSGDLDKFSAPAVPGAPAVGSGMFSRDPAQFRQVQARYAYLLSLQHKAEEHNARNPE